MSHRTSNFAIKAELDPASSLYGGIVSRWDWLGFMGFCHD